MEPWALSGGLLPDLQKLIAASPKLGELFTIKFPIPLSLTCYRIRPLDLLNVKKVRKFAPFGIYYGFYFSIFLLKRFYFLFPIYYYYKINFFQFKLYSLFAHPDERLLAETIVSVTSDHSVDTYFFDRTFALFLKYGVPAHHFVAESAQEFGEFERKKLNDKGGTDDNCDNRTDSFQDGEFLYFKFY